MTAKRPLESTTNQDTTTTSEPPRKKQKVEQEEPLKTRPDVSHHFILHSEEQHGIKLYLSAHFAPLRGLTKQRRSDFLVHEIARPKIQEDPVPKKELAVLTSRDETVLSLESHESRTKRLKSGVEALMQVGSIPQDKKEALELFVANAFPPHVPEVPKTFSIHVQKKEEDSEGIDLTTKGGRSEFFKTIKTWFSKDLFAEYNPETDESPERIQLSYATDVPDKRKWSGQTDYVRFVCFKENLTTTQAVREIAKMCRVKAKDISFAGSKDKRGVTTQFMTIHKTMPARLAKVNKKPSNYSTLKVGSFSWAKKPFTLGELWGNRFTMVLRKVEIQGDINDEESFRIPTEAEIEERVEALKTKGFINYFGMQRFGTYRTPTYQVGVEYLKGNLWDALKLILLSRSDTDPQYKELIDKCLDESSYGDTLQRIHRKKYQEEATILGSLARNPSDHLGAFNSISASIRSMYFHSYQSFIWNCMVTKRIETYGTNPVVGDLVYAEGSDQHTRSKEARVEHITADTIDKYTIFDVILPLPGTDVQYPSNDVNEQAFMNLMQEDGITIEHFKKVHKDYQLYGGYRNMLIQPEDMEFELTQYTDFKIPLVLNDMEVAQKKSLCVQPPVDEAHPEKCALVISFSLPSSCYATMFNRELLHMSSVQNWEELNEKNPKKKDGDRQDHFW